MESSQNQKIIAKIVPPPEQSAAEKEAEFALFRDNLDLIFRYAGTIIDTPQLFFCGLGHARISVAYLGDYHPSLGALLHLWQQGRLTDVCPHCGGELLLFCAGGSPLSGSNTCSGLCRRCRRVSGKTLPSFAPVTKTLPYIRAHLNIRKILRIRGQRFSFRHGLVGDPVPDQVIQKEVTPVTLEVLLRRLRKYESNRE
ncbi:MAG: hypothetical protein ACLFPD_12520 [Desulfosudaceae bacterium]